MSIARINNNVAAISANRNLEATGRSIQKSIERLSSGLRINRAGDDAAGLVVATRIRSQVKGLDRAIMNAQDGINLINVAEGALEEMTQRLDRIRVLSIQAANTGVNDFQARQALQDEVFQSIDEITRIADTTQFSKNKLLNGDFSVKTAIKPGQDGAENFGINIDQGPSSNTLNSGVSFLNIIQTKAGFAQMVPGLDANGVTRTMHTGIQNATDLAVSFARFSTALGHSGGSVGTAQDFSTGLFFNGVSIHAQASYDVFAFSGVLSDGVTEYNGSFSLADATNNTVNFLVSAINASIQLAEQALFGVSSTNSVPTAFRTMVTLASTGTNAGRLLMYSATESINQSSIDIRLVRSGNLVTQANGVTRSVELGANSALSGQGAVGNTVTSITGSTFQSGEFELTVEDVQGAQSRIVESTIIFRNKAGAIISRSASLGSASAGLSLNGSFVDGVYTGGVSITGGDTITLRGSEADGTTFEAVYTISNDITVDDTTNLNDFRFATISGLIAELNYRTRDYSTNNQLDDGDLSRFESAIYTLTGGGTLRLIDDIGRENSKLDFTFTFNDSSLGTTPSYTIQDKAQLQKEGFSESATFSINGGPKVRASAGDVIALFGSDETKADQVQEQVTLRVGSDLKVGKDIVDIEGKEYVGSLNGGPKVTFQNGAQDVIFIENGSAEKGVARIVTIDFDGILDITSSPNDDADPGTTVLISTNNSSMNFHIGAFAFNSFQTSIGDLTAKNLGFGAGSGRTMENIDIRTISGANEAIIIVDEALDQINRTRSLLGAATNRLEGTVANLSVSSENLLASESRLRDADLAKETTNFAKFQILLQAGTSVLAQANFIPQGFLSLLG